MRNALLATNRPIFYSICDWGEGGVGEWGNLTGNSWRTTGDISPTFESLKVNYLWNEKS